MIERRLIINIRDKTVDDQLAVSAVLAVIQQGKISNNDTQYCYVTRISNGLAVCADRNKNGNDVFNVYFQPKDEG